MQQKHLLRERGGRAVGQGWWGAVLDVPVANNQQLVPFLDAIILHAFS